MVFFMLKSLPRRAGRAALVMSAALAMAAPAYAQYAVETPEAALARNVRLLANNPRDFQALNAAGRAALETGDVQAAAGFFGRAEEISPRSWQPQAGMAMAMVAMGDPEGAMPYFARAQQFGATQMLIALDRGLAFDLIGDQAKAQSDYRVALQGAQPDEARRRLALSLAISRDIKGAAQTIDPLLRRGDKQAMRINAFVLALAGDSDGARRTIDATMPGAGPSFEPFFKILPVLRPSEKAAAVHLGIFPKDAAQRYAYAQPIPTSPTVSIGGSRQTIVDAPRPPQRSGAAASTKPKPAAKAPAPNTQRIREPFFSSMDPSRFKSNYAAPVNRQKAAAPKPKASEPAVAEAPDPDPEPRQAGRLADIEQLLSEQVAGDGVEESLVKVAEAEAPPPAPSFSDAVPVSKPKIEVPNPNLSKPKVETAKSAKAAADAKKKAEKLAAEKKAKAEAEKKAKAEAARLGVAGTNWVQLAGGANKDRMGTEYKKLAAKAGSLLKSRSGYVTEGKDYFRLLVGPFPSTDAAQEFVSKLDKAGVDSFRWTRNPAQIRIEKLKT